MSRLKEDFVFLVDDEAFINGKRMAELALALKSAGLYKRYFTYCRIDSILRLKDDVLPLWREIGLERLFVGIDAVSERDLVDYRKKTSISQIEDGTRRCPETRYRYLCPVRNQSKIHPPGFPNAGALHRTP